MAIQSAKASRHFSALSLAVFLVYASNPLALGQAQEKSAKLPQRVLLIRHAEKPLTDDPSIHLSPKGKERAEELYRLFEASANRPDPFPTPDFIFAAKDSKHSQRSVATVTPLAKKLMLTINSDYRDADYAKVAQEILQNGKYAGKTILICWHHGVAPGLANRLRAAEDSSSWKGSAFDRVWQITYDKDGKATFRDRPQQLLTKDSEK